MPGYLPLVLIFISSVFCAKAQDREKLISFTKHISAGKQTGLNNQKTHHSLLSDTIPCNCSVAPQIVPLSKQGNTRTYQGNPNAACTPINTIAFHGTGSPNLISNNPFDTCGVSNVTYAWSISSGGNIASINGSNNNSTVSVIV